MRCRITESARCPKSQNGISWRFACCAERSILVLLISKDSSELRAGPFWRVESLRQKWPSSFSWSLVFEIVAVLASAQLKCVQVDVDGTRGIDHRFVSHWSQPSRAAQYSSHPLIRADCPDSLNVQAALRLLGGSIPTSTRRE